MDPQIEELVGQLDSHDAGTRLLAIQALVSMTGPDVLVALRVAAESRDSNVRSMARKALSGRWTSKKPIAKPPAQVGPVNPGIIAVAPPKESSPNEAAPEIKQEALPGKVEKSIELCERSVFSLYFLSYKFFWVKMFRVMTYGLFMSFGFLVFSLVTYFGFSRLMPPLFKMLPAPTMAVAFIVVPFLFPSIGALVANFVAEGAFAKEVTNWYLNKERSISSSFYFCLSRIWSLTTSMIAWLVVYAIGFAAFWTIGLSADLWLSNKAFYGKLPEFVTYLVRFGPCTLYILRCHIMWYFAPVIAVVEDVGGLRALNRSVNLVRGSLLRVVLFRLLFLLTSAIGVQLVRQSTLLVGPSLFSYSKFLADIGLSSIQAIGLFIGSVILTPLIGISTSLLYFDQLVRKEHITLEALERTQHKLEYRGHDTLANEQLFKG